MIEWENSTFTAVRNCHRCPHGSSQLYWVTVSPLEQVPGDNHVSPARRSSPTSQIAGHRQIESPIRAGQCGNPRRCVQRERGTQVVVKREIIQGGAIANRSLFRRPPNRDVFPSSAVGAPRVPASIDVVIHIELNVTRYGIRTIPERIVRRFTKQPPDLGDSPRR